MNIIFCHDGPVSCDSDNRYYSIGFNDKLLSRYEHVFGKVDFITRVDRTAGRSEYTESDKLSVDRFRVIEYPNYLNFRGIFANKSQSTRRLEEEISKCDALIIRLPSFLGSKCVKIARKYNKPFLVEMVGCPWDSLRNHGFSGKILAPYLYLLTKYQVKRATDVLYVTGEFLQKRYPTNGRQIDCSDVELQNIGVADRERGSTKQIDCRNIVVGTVGKIDLKYKGHATVIEAIKLLEDKGYHVQYQIVGPGDKGYLEKIVKQNGVSDKVTFTGPMGHDEIFSWLDTIDIYIQPSLTEGMPRALIEAMSRGCPCVASNAGGMPELLDKAYIFRKDCPEQLADILLNGTVNGLYEQGARNAEFAKRFTPDVINAKREKFYNEFNLFVKRRLR